MIERRYEKASSYVEVFRKGVISPTSGEGVNFSNIFQDLLETEKWKASKIEISPPGLFINSSESQKSSDSFMQAGDSVVLSTRDRGLVSIFTVSIFIGFLYLYLQIYRI